MINFKKEFVCDCGKVHNALIENMIVENNAIDKLAKVLGQYGCKKPFVVADKNTFIAGGEKVLKNLHDNGLCYHSFIFDNDVLTPDEHTAKSLEQKFVCECDCVVGVGSGVINDLCKYLAKEKQKPYFIVATAPSMDGYASATSSMEINGLKVSLPTTCAQVIIGDTSVLKNAPMKMLVSGLGDMLAKYVSICEWKISNVITGEYYCPTISSLVKNALDKCVKNAKGLLERDPVAVEAVFNGLIMGGVAMNYAGLSRPASGVEHYFSHIFDMRSLEFGYKGELHGIQCAVATLYTCKIYEQIKEFTPNEKLAMDFVNDFDYSKHSENMKKFLGKSALPMIELEQKEKKYNKIAHHKRFEIIKNNWERILKIIDEIPSYNQIYKLLASINAPTSAEQIGIDMDTLYKAFYCTKDIRDKYVASRLCWDLGIIDKIML